MRIKSLKLRNYRNYEKLEIALNDGLNIFIGNNAQGKSNMLESIFVLALTKSYMNVKEKNLIKCDENFCLVSGIVSCNDIDTNFDVIITDDGKKLKINNIEIKKVNEYISRMKVLIFSPYNINFIKDGPNVRRKTINMVISQFSNRYIRLLQQYNAILKKRNQFLKIVNTLNESNNIYWDSINEQFSELAVEIMLIRNDYVIQINRYLKNIYKEITDYDNLVFCYNPSFSVNNFEDIKEKFKKKMNYLYEREKMYGMTLIGPHRDDFSFLLEEKDLSIYGSQGQIRSAMLSLKIAEVFLFKEVDGDYPILLLDDIFSELDVEKRNRLVKYMIDEVQTIITTTDIHMIDENLVNRAKVFAVCDGNIVEGKKECRNEK